MTADDLGRVAGAGRVSLLDRARDLIDRLQASPRFREWATAFPLTRPLARRRARQLFDLCAGFVYSQVLLACVRVRLFDVLAEGPRTVDALAPRLSLTPEAADRLLRAAAALRLVAPRGDGRWGLGALGAPLVGDAGIAAMVEHHAVLYADLADPLALLRDPAAPTRLSGYWPYAESGHPADLPADAVDAYTRLMAASQPMVAAEAIAAYPFARHRHAVDVGGGDGSFLAAVAAAAPSLRLTVFDLPPVAARARARFAAAGLSGRADTVGGDFHRDPLPTGADLMTLVRVLHDHDDGPVLALLRAARRALPDDGTLLIVEPMSGVPGAEAMGDAYFGFYLLAMRRGRPRTPEALAELIRRAGFAQVRPLATRTPMLAGLLVARGRSDTGMPNV
jgi:demethylspheroidene O-methyltransferase